MKYTSHKGTDEFTEDMILFKDLKESDKQRLYYYSRTNRLKIYSTPQGKAVKKQDVVDLGRDDIAKGRKGLPLDLSTPSKINCLYRRIRDMNENNKRACLANYLKLKRYIDEKGFVRINLREYITPQIKILANKLEVKESEIFSAIYDIIYDKYQKDREKEKALWIE